MAFIIAFEGIDGTGKGTQMERAACRLLAAGRRVERLSFPIYSSFFGREDGKLLTGSDGVRADTVDGKSMALWFARNCWRSPAKVPSPGADPRSSFAPDAACFADCGCARGRRLIE